MIFRNKTLLTMSALMLAGGGWARAEDAVVTLSQCHAWALQNSETRRVSREDILQSEARARAALGGLLPTVQWTWDRTWQDTKGLPVFNDPSGFSNSFALKRQDVSKFTVDQALFGGFREFSARAGFLKERDRDALRLDQQSLDIFQSVVASFYGVRASETLRDNVAEAMALAQKRTRELQSRYRLGKARESEIFSAESQVSALRAQWIHLGGQTRWARENLSYVTGRNVLADGLVDDEALTDRPAPLEEFTARLDRRPDIQAQQKDVEGRRLRVRYEKARYWPTLNFNGNYYTDRPAFYDAINWDAKLSLAAPIYQGGEVGARTAEAVSQLRQSEDELARLRRWAQTDVAQRHALWVAALDEVGAYREGFEAADKSFRRHEEEYRLGLVTNLDVLQAINDRLAMKKAWDDARLNARRAYWDLRAAVGSLP